jgi:ascorbate-specific PTS system EIIC-type component UlaA
MNIFKLFGLIIVVLILLTGIVLLFSSYFEYIPKNIRIVLGFLLISYGSFRLVNIIIKSKKQSDEDTSNE